MPPTTRQPLFLATAAAILMLALGLRLVALDKGLRLDEYSSLEVTTGSDWVQKLRAYDHPPLYFLLLRAARTVSDEVAWLRLLSVAAGVGMVVCAMLWLYRYGRVACLLGGLLLATHPELVHYGQEIRHYSLLLFLTVLALALADRMASKAGRGALALALALTVAVATHLIAIFVWTSVLLYLGVRWFFERSFSMRALALPVLLPALLLGVFTLSVSRLVGAKQTHWWMQPPDLESLGKIAEAYLARGAVEGWAESAQRLSPLLGGATQIVLWGALAVVAATLLHPLPDRRGRALPAAAFFFAVQTLVVSSWIVPVLVPRSGLPLLVIVIAAIAIQAARPRRPWVSQSVVLAPVVLAVAWASWWAAAEGWKPLGPWKNVAHELAGGWREGDVVLFSPPYVQGPIQFYFPALEAETAVALSPRLELNDFRELLTRVIENRAGARLWIVARHNPNLIASQDRFDAMMAELETRFPTEIAERRLAGGVTLKSFRLDR